MLCVCVCLFLYFYLSIYLSIYVYLWASQVTLVINNSPAHTGDIKDMCSIPGLRRYPGGGHGNPFQYSSLENPMDREPGGLQSIGSQRVRHNWSNLALLHASIYLHFAGEPRLTHHPTLPIDFYFCWDLTSCWCMPSLSHKRPRTSMISIIL